MDLVERSGNTAPENIDAFRDARVKDYRLLVIREVLIGQNVSIELLNAVTQREVQAGRMTEIDELRQLALKGISEPYRRTRTGRWPLFDAVAARTRL
jgi:hypothetical protein